MSRQPEQAGKFSHRRDNAVGSGGREFLLRAISIQDADALHTGLVGTNHVVFPVAYHYHPLSRGDSFLAEEIPYHIPFSFMRMSV